MVFCSVCMQIRITEANFNCEIQMSGSGVISPYDANEEMTASKAVLGRGRIQDFHMGGGGEHDWVSENHPLDGVAGSDTFSS